MGKIKLLDELTANKIAAGEVVERPASVVKELIESSIDAGSSRIEISVTGGGLTRIAVSDNGAGMDENDARLAFERHATSKITGAADLEHIRSLGFRGEALPSIAAVSRLHLKTRVKEAISGTEVIIEGGTILRFGEAGCPAGTTIEVRDLFYNTPARKKHLKMPTTETGHISEVVNKFAMGYPHIAFQFNSNDRVVTQTPGSGDLLQCIAAVYGSDTARELLFIEAREGEASVTGYIGKPSLSRSGRNHQTVYVNGRFVRSRVISEAVEQAFHGMLMTGRYPIFVISIRIDPEEVDVNVHPAKTEVRLANPDILQKLIGAAAASALSGNRLIPSGDKAPKSRVSHPVAEVSQEEWKVSYAQLSAAAKICEVPQAQAYCASGENQQVVSQDIPQEVFTGKAPEVSSDNMQEPAVTSGENPGAVPTSGFPDLRPIGQIDCTFIVAQGSDGMYLIDQHAAHERILYEEHMEKPEEYTTSEQLLFPVAAQLTFQEAQVLSDNIICLTDLGFVFEHFGGETFLLRAVPAGISHDGGKEIFLDLLDYFSRNRCTISGKVLREKFLITMACKNAIKANQKLALPEMESLLCRLACAKNPYTCPHGRPTLLHFSAYELEKKFKRVL